MPGLNVLSYSGVSFRSFFAALACFALLFSGQACPVDASELSYRAPHTSIRLFSAGADSQDRGAPLAAGIEIMLEPGWKTYWRSPGEGMPPSFAWDESYNLKSAEVLWPAPTRFAEGGFSSVGYQDRVVLPVLITPQDATKPVNLSLSIAYGICKDICMPVEAQLSLDMDTPFEPADRDALQSAMAQVPKRQGADGAACPHRVVAARRVTLSGSEALRVETSYDEGAEERDLLAETEPDLVLPAPTLEAGGAPGRSAYVFAPDAASAAPLKGRMLGFTALSSKGSCESKARIE